MDGVNAINEMSISFHHKKVSMNTKEMHSTLAHDGEGKTSKNEKVQEATGKHEDGKKAGAAAPKFEGSSFSTYYTWRGNGGVKLNCGNGSINSNSRVVAAISEYNTDPTQNRFIGSASMQIYNVAPYNGGVVIWLYVNWNNPLNVRVNLLIDP